MNLSTNSNFPSEIDLYNGSENFGIEKLRQRLSDLYGQAEPAIIDLLTASLIEQLTNNLELLAEPEQWHINDKNNLHAVACFPNLPASFPDSAKMPMYLYGDKVFHQSLEEYFIVIGRFYAFERQQSQWGWKYLILANQDWAIAPFNFAYLCWETDLQPLD